MEATIKTTKGDINLELYSDLTPKTVENFVGLVKGTKEWIHPKDRKPQKGNSLYKDVPFHRVIKDFMIQTGDPLGNGTGGPGYTFADEFHPSLKHEKYVLSMANRGPNTNGSQFFITLVETSWLDGKHTVFGKVTDAKSKEVVDSIGLSKTSSDDRPLEPILIKEIIIK